MSETIIQVLQYTIPSIIVLITAYLLLSTVLNKLIKMREVEISLKNRQDSIPIRLQAYERMVLYLERINIQSLISRILDDEMIAHTFHYSLITNIRSEYEHNITQQLYISIQTWTLVKTCTEETISIINQAASTVPPDVPATHLARELLHTILNTGEALPTQRTIDILKSEAKELF